jgi:hypothetical protein
MLKTNKNKSSKVRDANVAYKGPIKIPKPLGLDVASLRINKATSFVAATNGSGVLVYSLATDDITACADWASIQASWKEFRVLGLQVEFIPINATSTTGGIAVVAVKNHNPSGGTLTSVNEAQAYDTKINFSSQKLQNTIFEIRGQSFEELEFQDTVANVNRYSIETYSTAGANSTNYFNIVETFLLELRGMK